MKKSIIIVALCSFFVLFTPVCASVLDILDLIEDQLGVDNSEMKISERLEYLENEIGLDSEGMNYKQRIEALLDIMGMTSDTSYDGIADPENNDIGNMYNSNELYIKEGEDTNIVYNTNIYDCCDDSIIWYLSNQIGEIAFYRVYPLNIKSITTVIVQYKRTPESAFEYFLMHPLWYVLRCSAICNVEYVEIPRNTIKMEGHNNTYLIEGEERTSNKKYKSWSYNITTGEKNNYEESITYKLSEVYIICNEDERISRCIMYINDGDYRVFDYSYDDCGNIISIDEMMSRDSLDDLLDLCENEVYPQYTSSFYYDDCNRLIDMEEDTKTGNHYTFVYNEEGLLCEINYWVKDEWLYSVSSINWNEEKHISNITVDKYKNDGTLSNEEYISLIYKEDGGISIER